MKLLVSNRNDSYTTVHQLRTIGISDTAIEALADADAFRSTGHDRRKALWEVSTQDKPLSLFNEQKANAAEEQNIALPEMTLGEHVIQDYATMALSLKAHPVSFVREKLAQLNVLSAAQLATANDGDMVKVAGLILVRQRPGTASGICFITLEDETGVANLVVFQKLFDEYRKEIIQSKLLMVEGKLQKEGEVIHVIVKRCFNFSKLLQTPTTTAQQNLAVSMSRADETTSPFQGKIFPDGRNFR